MQFLQNVLEAISTNSTIVGLFGANCIYPIVLPQQSSNIGITYKQESGQTQYEQAGLYTHVLTYSFRVIANSYDDALVAQEAIRSELELTIFTCTEGEMDRCEYAGFIDEGYYDDIAKYFKIESYQFQISN